jgi:type I restriction enzyme, S subunit
MNIAAYPTYDSYKDSGVEWIGELPATWSVERGKWLFVKKDRSVRPDDEIVTCFRDGQVTLRSNRRTDGFTNALKEHGYQGIRKGDLVIHAMDAFAGAIGVSDSDGKATPVYSACVPRVPDTVDPYFYAYYMRHIALSGLLVSLAKGIRERSTDFRYNDFADLQLAVPSLPEQRAIAAFLDESCAKVDEAVRIKEEQIALLRERRQILIQQAVTRGLNPAAPMKDSGIDWIGQVPAHWEVVRFKYLFTQSRLPVRKDDGVVTSYRDGQVTLRANRRMEGYTEAILEGGYQGIRVGQLVLNSMDAFEGAIGVSDSDGKCTPEYVICDPVNDGINQYFFAYLLREMALADYIEVICNAVRQRAVRIRFNNLATRFMVLPPPVEQAEIVAFVEREKSIIADAIAIKEDQIAALKEYKTSLINAAVTGKIKVSH